MRPQECNLLINKAEAKVGGEALLITTYLFKQPLRPDPVERGEIRIDNHSVATNGENAVSDALGGDMVSHASSASSGT